MGANAGQIVDVITETFCFGHRLDRGQIEALEIIMRCYDRAIKVGGMLVSYCYYTQSSNDSYLGRTTAMEMPESDFSAGVIV
jgi:hypothetical protein